MTINTSPLQQTAGSIFSDKDDMDTEARQIQIGWLKDTICSNGCVKFAIKNGGTYEWTHTHNLNKCQNYDIALNFDGKLCEFYIDGNSVEPPIDCSRGIGTLGSPNVCYNPSGDEWIGSITNLRFERSKGKSSNITFHYYLFP